MEKIKVELEYHIWDFDNPCDEVELLKPVFKYSLDRTLFYVRNVLGWPKFWMSVKYTKEELEKAGIDPTKDEQGIFSPGWYGFKEKPSDEGISYYRKSYNFAFWKIKSGEDEEVIADTPYGEITETNIEADYMENQDFQDYCMIAGYDFKDMRPQPSVKRIWRPDGKKNWGNCVIYPGSVLVKFNNEIHIYKTVEEFDETFGTNLAKK